MFRFKRSKDRVYELVFDDKYEMAMLFLRYEEFYESPKYRGRKFTLAEYISWYTKKPESPGLFNYHNDWTAFNLPAKIIKEVHDLGIQDPNHYDSIMLGLYGMMTSQDEDPYLIGYKKGSTANSHELSHAMYYLSKNYRDDVQAILKDDNLTGIVWLFSEALRDIGYHDNSIEDEIQAYINTGLVKRLLKLTKEPGYDELKKRLNDCYNYYNSKFK